MMHFKKSYFITSTVSPCNIHIELYFTVAVIPSNVLQAVNIHYIYNYAVKSYSHSKIRYMYTELLATAILERTQNNIE